MSEAMLSEAATRHKPKSAEEIEAAVRRMATAGYTVLTISHALTLHAEVVKTILALDFCE
jgi:ABC-type branched-subunit amino acid transport system ATPase component